MVNILVEELSFKALQHLNNDTECALFLVYHWLCETQQNTSQCIICVMFFFYYLVPVVTHSATLASSLALPHSSF